MFYSCVFFCGFLNSISYPFLFLLCIELTTEENPTKRQKSSASATAAPDQSSSEYPRPIAGAVCALPESAPRCWKGRCNSGTYSLDLQEGPTITEGKLSVKWSVPLVKCVDASPLVLLAPSVVFTAGTPEKPNMPAHLVIIGSHGGDVVAVDGASGAVVWTLQLGEHIEASAVCDTTATKVFLGTFSGQDVDGFQSRRPVGVTSDGETELGCFWCLDALTGDIVWHVCTAGEIKGAALVIDECVFVGAYDGHLYQFRVSDGALIGKYPCGGSIYAAPVQSTDGKCIFVATTAGTLTQFAYSGGSAPLTVQGTVESAPIFATPLATPAGGLLTAATDGSVTHWIQQSKDGRVLTPKWREVYSAKPIFSSPCLVCPTLEGVNAAQPLCLVGCHDGRLRLFQTETGTLQWESSHNRVAVFSSPGTLSKNLSVSATVAGEVEVTQMSSGAVVATLQLPGEIFSSAVCLGDCVYIGCRDDRLYCLQLASS